LNLCCLTPFGSEAKPRSEFSDAMAPITDSFMHIGAAIEAHYQFLTWPIPTIVKFPKSHKFTIGDRVP